MGNEAGVWVMHGMDATNPDCLHTVEQASEYIKRVGFLPLFKNEIPGFSLEERTEAGFWWCGDAQRDPWEWREILARKGELAYGKFFEKKAGFIAKEWLPFFANYRRDGYDFDARWEDEKASGKQKKVMDLFDTADEPERYSNEIKRLAGFGKEGDKGFEGVLTSLQMQLYLCCKDFRQRKNKKGEVYGWPIAVLATPEHIFGKECVTGAYTESPEASRLRIENRIRDLFPDATLSQIRKIIG